MWKSPNHPTDSISHHLLLFFVPFFSPFVLLTHTVLLHEAVTLLFLNIHGITSFEQEPLSETSWLQRLSRWNQRLHLWVSEWHILQNKPPQKPLQIKPLSYSMYRPASLLTLKKSLGTPYPGRNPDEDTSRRLQPSVIYLLYTSE